MPENVEVSVICTTYNEGESVRELLDSIVDQRRVPDEAVFVDGGSDDETVEIIEEYAEEHEWIEVYVEEGCNIAEGRNRAVEEASNDYIVGTDAGCVLEEGWVEAMAKAFEYGNEALSGLFQPRTDNLFEFVQGELRCHGYSPENVDDNWPPSSRSVGFTREVWEEAGGYPEDLYTGEDAKFNSNVRRAGYEWHVVRDAMVYWEMRPTLRSYFRQFYLYGEGDARAGNLFDYPGKIFGVPKSLAKLGATWMGLIGTAGLYFTPWSLAIAGVGFGAIYGYYLPNLVSAVNEKGLRAVPYWDWLVATETMGYFLGFHKEVLKKWLPL